MSEAKRRRLTEKSLTIPEDNSRGLADDLAKSLLFNDGTADIILKVQDDRLPAHRAILAARCDYFRAMLYGGMQESAAKEVQIDNFSPAVMRLLLRYIYTERLGPATLEDAVPLMACADHYGVKKLHDALRCQIAASLSHDTVLEVFSAALESHQELLVENCLHFATTEAVDVLTSDAFLQLDATKALRVLRVDGMQDRSALCLKAAARWQAHWTKLVREDGLSRRAEEAAADLSSSSEMRQYIDTATMQLVDQLVETGPTSGIEAKPATILQSRRDGDELKAIEVKPSTARTRITVHRLRQGMSVLVGNEEGSITIGLLSTGTAVAFDEIAQPNRRARGPAVQWERGTVVDVIMVLTPAGECEVSVHDVADRPFHSCLAGVKIRQPRLRLNLPHSDDEVSVEFLQ